ADGLYLDTQAVTGKMFGHAGGAQAVDVGSIREANTGTMILPAYTVVDVRIGGEVDQFFWSLSVQNLFNKLYTDYALDQGFGFFAFYPLPGRIVMAKAGVKF
ncbi:MAG: TonB-dependent receptor, partial [Pseudorhodoplanes sp.]